MRSVKCSGCGANLNFDGTRKIMKCQYCGTVYKDESKFETTEPLSTPYVQQSTKVTTVDDSTERPKFSMFGFIVLLFISFPFAIIYLLILKAQQKSWDDQHGGH